MANYSYRGRDERGHLVQGEVEASTEASAAEILLRRGITPIHVAPFHAPSRLNFDLRELLGSGINSDDLIVFTRQMYALTKAGIPLLRAMQGLAENTSNRRLGQVLTDLVDQLERGRQLSSAMAAHPKIFPRLFVAIVHVGENTGQLEQAFLELTDYLQKEEDTRKQVKTAMRYPTFIMITIVVAMFILNLFVIPSFASMFARFDAELPLTTRILITTSNFFVHWWYVLLGSIAAIAYAIHRYINTEEGEIKWDYLKIRMPLVGDILFRTLLTRFSRSFATMLRAGVPLTQALGLVADAVDNRWMGHKINEMRRNIERGENLSRVARHSQLFTPLVLQMLQVGEETGRVDEMLMEVSDYYEREVDYDLKSLTAKIEPIMLAIVAVMISVMAAGIFSPMWDMMNAYTGR